MTEYFKLVCRYCFGCPRKPSIERRIQYERMSTRLSLLLPSVLLFTPRLIHLLLHPSDTFSLRHAAKSHPPPTTAYAMFSPNRPHTARHPIRKTATLPRPLLAPNDLVFPNLLHTPLIRAGRGDILRLPDRLSKSMLYRRLRDDSVPPARPRHRACTSDQTASEEGQEERNQSQVEGYVQLDRL